MLTGELAIWDGDVIHSRLNPRLAWKFGRMRHHVPGADGQVALSEGSGYSMVKHLTVGHCAPSRFGARARVKSGGGGGGGVCWYVCVYLCVTKVMYHREGPGSERLADGRHLRFEDLRLWGAQPLILIISNLCGFCTYRHETRS